MRPTCTPITNQELQQAVTRWMETTELKPEIHAHQQIIAEAIAALFKHLPKIIESKKQASLKLHSNTQIKGGKRGENRKIDHIGDKMRVLESTCALERAQLQSLRQRICAEVSLTLYKDYIENVITEQFIPYCGKHKPPKRWSKGSVFHFKTGGKYWGRTFYNFWKNHIETDTDELFRQKILPRLPQEWQNAYDAPRENQQCSYEWNEMTPQAIAKILATFKKPRDPASGPWRSGAVIYWTGPNGEEWGKSFWGFWRKHIEKTGDSLFTTTIVPHLPETVRKNHKQMKIHCSHKWDEMNDQEIAQALTEMRRPHGIKKWGLGSTYRWTGQKGGNWGQSFSMYWRRKEEDDGEDELFRKHILPHLPAVLRETYKMKGYIMPLREYNDEDIRATANIEDMDKLHKLAEAGNKTAYVKLIVKLQELIENELPEFEAPTEIIERIANMHLAFFGKIRAYTIASIKNYNRRLFPQTSITTAEGSRARGGAKTVEEAMADKIDIKRIVDTLKSAGISIQTINKVFDLLIDGEVEESEESPDIARALHIIKTHVTHDARAGQRRPS